MPWKDGVDRSAYKYGPRTIMSPEEVGEMIKKADRARDECLIAVHYLTGARVSEIIELKREHITITDEELTIRFKARKKRTYGPLLKTDKLIFSRDAPFTDRISDYLLENNFNDDDYIFPGRGEHLTRQRVWQIIKGLNPQTSSHFFRHTRLNKLSRKGFNLEDLRKWSGRKTSPTEYMEKSEKDIRKIGREVD